jgi:hypothetical protein
MPYFGLSLVLYLKQACLQPLSKVSGSQSSHGLQLCPSHHLGSLTGQPENIILSEVSQGQKAKGAYFLSYVEYRPKQIQQYYEKHAKGRSHVREGG